MSIVTQVVQEIKSEFTISSDGQVKASIRGIAKLLGINDTSIIRSGAFSSKKLAEILAPYGFNAAAFVKDGVPDTAIALIAKYFAYKANRTTPQAEAVCDAFMAIGIRAWVHEQLGWQQNQQPVQHHRIYWERLRLFEQHTKIPLGSWCIFSELGGLMRDLETGGVVLPPNACPDISVGKCWNKYLESKGYEIKTFQIYRHHYPDQRGVQDANIYPDKLLPMFREWLGFTYISGKFPEYARKICSADELELIAMAVGNPVQLSINSRGHKFLGMARQG